MVRFLAEKGADSLDVVKAFDRLDYRCVPELSKTEELVFLRK